ncbi:MAG: hypothetical protein RLZ98_2448 [Pseudomonadota bacterium]|jgi:HAD superfamily hydrolase (TIGR01459 family)
MPADSACPPIITHADALLCRYDAVLCDIWGVLHNGVTEYTAAGDALERYRAQGGIVVLLSNSPAPSQEVASILAGKDVRRTSWDRIVSSGDLTRARMRELGLARVHHIGPDRDLPLFAGQRITLTGFETAEALVATGLIDDRNEDADDYRDLLEQSVDLGLPMICANPDRIVDVGGTMLQCAGALGDVYEELGGRVFWEGKPYPHAYDMAVSVIEEIAGSSLSRQRILAIGDSVGTDMQGAAGAGIDALFVAQGIHREDVLKSGAVCPDGLSAILAAGAKSPVAATAELTW